MVTATKPWVWQGTTQDGHRLILTRSGLVTISSRLKQSGLQSLVQQNLNGNLGKAILRAVAQIVNHARRSGLRSHPNWEPCECSLRKVAVAPIKFSPVPMVLNLPLSSKSNPNPDKFSRSQS
ncbi:MAG: hypothetical protein HC825_04465 [Oscillatoriales cyanobacterium RM1_1_9]|nr:hypothetical protein [Oscillatoriales cyanobacterium RM1_1_9]